MVNVVNKTLLQ